MNKRQKERLEREKLKSIIENNPNLRKFLDANIGALNKEDIKLKELVEPAVLDSLQKARLLGVLTGWYAHSIQCVKKIKSCNTIEEAIDVLQKEAEKAEQKLNISKEAETE